jgi:hypothetical protein|tara:strand:- start:247 stop:606 length:360 start_codon:yes stop_codon:yes gene_type:complete
MPVKVYSSGEHIQNMNGVNVKEQKYELAVNPNNNNKVHVSVTNDGLTIKKEYDSLENFFNEINNSEEGLISNMQKDLKKFESMPAVLYTETTTQKINNPKKHKKKKSKRKLKKRKSVKK